MSGARPLGRRGVRAMMIQVRAPNSTPSRCFRRLRPTARRLVRSPSADRGHRGPLAVDAEDRSLHQARGIPPHPSLRHILLIDPDAVAAKLYSRPDEGAWSDVDLTGGDAVIELSAIEVALPLAALYERIELPA